MNAYAKYYEENLYPLQNGVLSIVTKSGTPFFLTGGTALSRYYVNHRYSDDLDLFVVNDPKYPKYIEMLLRRLIESEKTGKYRVDRSNIKRGKDFTQLLVTDSANPDVELRIDLINDVAAHYGELETDPILGQVDSWRNILSNKLTALFRSEPKDVVDIQTIARNMSFNWKSIISEAKTKEAGIEPETVYDILMSFPVRYIKEIKWIAKPNKKSFTHDIKTIAGDILFGRNNSISPAKSKKT